MTHDSGRKQQRRTLLKGLAAGTVAAAATLAVAAPRRALAIPESKEVREKTRYRLTEHIEHFYRTNRY